MLLAGQGPPNPRRIPQGLNKSPFPWIKWEVIGVGLRVDMTSLRNPDGLYDTDHRMEMLSGCTV